MQGGIGIIKMLYHSNILALVGGGKKECFPKNEVIIWDDSQRKSVCNLSFNNEILNLKLKKDR